MAKVAKKAPRKAANGYKLPEPIPKGEILTDVKKQRWIIGPSIGIGGFGEIYSAALYKDKTPQDYPCVVKIEPHENGPLFVEMHFYMRNANAIEIEKWKKDKKLKGLGMPKFLGSGSHELKGMKYRFLVMDRYGTDLWKLFLENNRIFPHHTVYKVIWQIINVLEYIHQKSYVHGDIKGANLLLELKNPNQVYLLDFGLACKVNSKEEYKLNPKKAHNGTIEYTSRDNHMGVPTMRGDFEILFYNMVQWMCGKLPWEDNLKTPAPVQAQKEKAFSDVNKFLSRCFKSEEVPKPIKQFLTLLASMKFNEVPPYDKFREILELGLKELGHNVSGKLEFSKDLATKRSERVSTPRGRKAVESKVVAKKKEVVEPKVPKVATKKREVVARVTPTRSKRKVSSSPLLFDDSTDNDMEESFVVNEKCISGRELKKKLQANLESGIEYEVQIKRKK